MNKAGQARRRRRQGNTGSLRERPPGSGKWEVRFRRRSVTIFAKTRGEAHEQLIAFIERVRSGGLPKLTTFQALYAQYLRAKARKNAPTTIHKRQRDLEIHVFPLIGERQISELETHDVQRVLERARNRSGIKRKKGKGLGSRTLRRLLVTIRAVLAWGAKQGLVRRNVAANVELPEASDVERPVLDIEKAKSLLGAAGGSEFEAIIPVAIGTGLRRAELLGWLWSDLDLDGLSQ